MAKPTRRLLMTKAVTSGFLGGSRFWTMVGTLGLAMKVLEKLTRDEPEVVYCERLSPGETLLISSDRQTRVVQRRR